MPHAGDMSCRRARGLLELQLAELLPWEQGAALEEHLGACPACRREREAQQALAGELRLVGPLEPPTDLWQRVSAELQRPPAAAPAVPLWRRLLAMPTPLAATAVAAAVALLALAHAPRASLPQLPLEQARTVTADTDAAFYAQQHAVASWSGPAQDQMALGTTLVRAVSAQEAGEQP